MGASLHVPADALSWTQVVWKVRTAAAASRCVLAWLLMGAVTGVGGWCVWQHTSQPQAFLPGVQGSTELGCGLAQCPSLGGFVVCFYNPPGNVGGRFPDNVGQA